MNTSIVAHEEPHLTIRLEYEAGEGQGQLELANQVITAVDALAAGWLEPLAWEMYVGCLDAKSMDTPIHHKPPQPYWLLRKERIPIGVEIHPIYKDHMIVIEPVLSSERIQSWVAQALAQTCAPRFVPYWASFDSLAMRARLPSALDDLGARTIDLKCYKGTLTIPLEYTNGQSWISGRPDDVLVGPPVRLAAGNLYGMVINLDLEVYWSPWLEQPGRALVDAAVERVLALGRGWRCSDG